MTAPTQLKKLLVSMLPILVSFEIKPKTNADESIVDVLVNVTIYNIVMVERTSCFF